MNRSGLASLDPRGQLILSRALAASRPSLIAFLVTRGTELSGGVSTPISFCNVLFVGNLCAALSVGIWFGFGSILSELKRLKTRAVIGLVLNGLFAALMASLIFTGLSYTTVTNAVLLGRFGPVLYALAGSCLSRKPLSRFEWIGFSFILFGIFAIVLQENMFNINQGDLLILGSTFVFAISSLVSKATFSGMSNLSVVVFSRNFISSVVFFVIAVWLFGPEHFSDAFSGQLWSVMFVYALIVIVFAQFLWFSALGQLDSRAVGRLTALSPVFGVFYAFVLNGERPSSVQVTAFLVIMVGVLITNFSKQPKDVPRQAMMNGAEGAASAS